MPIPDERAEDDRTANGGAEPARRMALAAFAVRVAAAGLAYGLQVVLARSMGGHDYGVYVVVWTAVTLIGPVSGLGFETLVVRSTPTFMAARAFASLRGMITAARLIAFTVASAFALGAVVVVQALPTLIDPDWRVPIMLGAACLPLFAVTEIQDGTARAQDWPDLALGPTYILRPLLILFLIVMSLAAGSVVSTESALIAAIGATWITGGLQLFFLGRRLHVTAPTCAPEMRMARWTGEALPILMVDIAFVLITGADVLMVGLIAEPHDVAVYFAAAKSLALVQFVQYAVRTAAAREFATRVHDGDRAALAAAALRASRWTFWPAAGFAAVTLAAAPWMLALFGRDFAGGEIVMAVLALGLLARASVGPAETLLTMSGRQGLAALVYAGSLATMLGFGVVLTPMFGIVGAATAAALGMGFEAIAFSVAARFALGLDVFVFAGVRAAPHVSLAREAEPWAG